MGKIKTFDLRSKKREELVKMLEEQKTELANLQVGLILNFKRSKNLYYFY